MNTNNVCLRTYEKPDVNLVESAVTAVQNPIEKADQLIESDPTSPYLESAAAYAADE